MAYRFKLKYPDGTDAGEAAYGDTSIQAGSEIIVSGNRRLRVRAVLPAHVANEFADGDLAGLLVVEPVG